MIDAPPPAEARTVEGFQVIHIMRFGLRIPGIVGNVQVPARVVERGDDAILLFLRMSVWQRMAARYGPGTLTFIDLGSFLGWAHWQYDPANIVFDHQISSEAVTA